MLREDNIFYAKRNLVDSIWKEARLEGIAVTFPQTAEIVEGRSVAGLPIDDVMAVNNLKHTWQYILDSLDTPNNLNTLKKINYKIREGGVVRYAGDLRTGIVRVGGTNWVPEVPNAHAIEFSLSEINKLSDPTNRALHMMAYICRAQMFTTVTSGQRSSLQIEFSSKTVAVY